MGIFGHDAEQDERLDAIEHHMRRMTEQIGQLSVDLGVTRMELLKARVAVGEAVKATELDPVFGQLNVVLKDTRAKLEASQAASDEAWITLQDSSDNALETMRTGVESAWSTVEEGNPGLAPTQKSN